MRRLDVSAMCICLWLLTSMIVDVLTPKELSIYLIAAATAPGLIILAILYWRGISRQDFAIVFGALWLVTAIMLEFLSSQPLSFTGLAIAGSPPLIVGCAIYYLRWDGSRRRSRSS